MSLAIDVAAGLAVLALLLARIRAARTPPPPPADDEEHDVVIVGGGTAGCVLAARLSEHPGLRVLLIEAGQSARPLPASTTPAAFFRLFGGPHDYNLHTVPQRHAANKPRFWPRARLLGGCSSINALMAQFGAPSDYDEFATIVGDASWSWKHIVTYFRKFENYSPHPRFPLVDPAAHGAHGPVTIGYHAHTSQGGLRFVQASVNAGIPFSPDFNTSNGTLGTNKIMTYIDHRGQRVSAESAYLTPHVLARPNLKVITRARVTRIVFDSSSATPRAVAVEFAGANHPAPRFRARARKEVIICGGAVHSPQILMLSGIGPASLLKQHNIPLVVDSPGVGGNLSDHPTFHLRFKDKLGVSLNYSIPYDLLSTLKLLKALVQYRLFGTGPLSTNVGEAAAFFRIDDPKLFPPAEYTNKIQDTTSGPDAPDIELILLPAVNDREHPPEPGLHAYSILTTLLRQVSLPLESPNNNPTTSSPTSVGSVQIRSADPWDDPIIDPNYLATQHDLDTLVRGARMAYRIAHTAPLTDITDVGYTHPLLDHHLDRLSDKELGELIRERIVTLYHPLGTCTMGRADNPLAVLDTQLRVRGVLGLRVCDASIYPKLVSGHTAGPVFAAAEKLADIIKEESTAAA